MKFIDTDELKKELRHIYELAGWEPKEVHFSLLDMESNIDNIKSVLILDTNTFKATLTSTPLPEPCDPDIVSWKAIEKIMTEVMFEREE